LSWEQQDEFFAALPEHLREMAILKVNTGCREKEVCQLRWEWEYEIPGTNATVFIIPQEKVKNGEDRLVVLNRLAKQVVDRQRGHHPTQVFTYRGKPVLKMNNTAWQRVQRLTDLPLRVHDLKHTFGRRLRAAGVSYEDRQDLLGHRSGRITTHYSAAEIHNLIDAANLVCDRQKKQSSGTVADQAKG
jgi:integrase